MAPLSVVLEDGGGGEGRGGKGRKGEGRGGKRGNGALYIKVPQGGRSECRHLYPWCHAKDRGILGNVVSPSAIN